MRCSVRNVQIDDRHEEEGRVEHKEHRWSGWPGAWCLDCGCEDPREVALADGRVDDNGVGVGV